MNKAVTNPSQSAQRRQLLHSLRAKLSHVPSSRITGWYGKRKRASQRLKVISQGSVEIAEPGYRGDDKRHWLRHECGCVFTVSLHELAGCNHDEICPLCSINSLNDLTRFGSVDALGELIRNLTQGRIDFPMGNRLGASSEEYGFVCQVHGGYLFFARFSDVVNDPDKNHCPLCDYWSQETRN